MASCWHTLSVNPPIPFAYFRNSLIAVWPVYISVSLFLISATQLWVMSLPMCVHSTSKIVRAGVQNTSCGMSSLSLNSYITLWMPVCLTTCMSTHTNTHTWLGLILCVCEWRKYGQCVPTHKPILTTIYSYRHNQTHTNTYTHNTYSKHTVPNQIILHQSCQQDFTVLSTRWLLHNILQTLRVQICLPNP